MKTRSLKGYIEKIDALNDQLWYFLFLNEELNNQLSNYSERGKQVFTTDLFKNNPYSRRIHVKIIDLFTHQEHNKAFTFGSYFSTSYEISSNYIRYIFEELKVLNSLGTYAYKNNFSPEENLGNLLNSNGLALPPTYLVETFTYLRLRRNHFTHISSSPNSRLTDFVNTSGNGLQTKWQISGIAPAIDFTSLSHISEFNKEEVIDLIKVLRICLIELDEYIAPLLDINGIIGRLVHETFGSKPVRINSEIVDSRNKIIIKMMKRIFDITVNESQTSAFVSTIGVR